WRLISPQTGSFSDNQDITAWYFPFIETAISNGVITNEQNFRPKDAITREEMAIMMVRTLGYNNLALQLSSQKCLFTDVTKSIGYMNLLKDFAIVVGSGNNLYKPTTTATREEAAAILIRMYNKLHEKLNHLYGFYSSGAYSQKELINGLDGISFDWIKQTYSQGNLELTLALPAGYEEPIAIAKSKGMPVQLMLLIDNSQQMTLENGASQSVLTYLFTNDLARKHLIDNIVTVLTGNVPFDGITIDFESMSSASMAPLFNSFLTELDASLVQNSKTLTVAVQPQENYKGYDYKAIGKIADHVILMAHDYETKKLSTTDMARGFTYTPLTPIKSIYSALKSITDPLTGVQDKNKIYLQISFSSAQWQLSNNQVINATPYNPTYDMIKQRLLQEGVDIHYDLASQNTYATYLNSETNLQNVIWYEDSRSVLAKVTLAQMFGINNISLWRLGNIPNYPAEPSINLNVWESLLSKFLTQ
ncbi:MAG: S-layer homology domain-containing protein, partial [Vallitaleaceae bacterium]|nr:S-layer homology domain-containing protein [Vallitaleaceae bacterium]